MKVNIVVEFVMVCGVWLLSIIYYDSLPNGLLWGVLSGLVIESRFLELLYGVKKVV